jgi:hypothetical protein
MRPKDAYHMISIHVNHFYQVFIEKMEGSCLENEEP